MRIGLAFEFVSGNFAKTLHPLIEVTHLRGQKVALFSKRVLKPNELNLKQWRDRTYILRTPQPLHFSFFCLYRVRSGKKDRKKFVSYRYYKRVPKQLHLFHLKFYVAEIRRGLKCADHLRYQTLLEFRGIWVAEDDEKIGASIARAAQCEVDVDTLYLPD